MNVNEVYPESTSDFLHANDVVNHPINITIETVEVLNVKNYNNPSQTVQKLAIRTSNGKIIVLNATQAKAISMLLGAETNLWVGHDLIVGAVNVMVNGVLRNTLTFVLPPIMDGDKAPVPESIPF